MIVNYNQCDHIRQFIALWATFQSLWQQLFWHNLRLKQKAKDFQLWTEHVYVDVYAWIADPWRETWEIFPRFTVQLINQPRYT